MTKNRLLIAGAVLLITYAAVMVFYEAHATNIIHTVQDCNTNNLTQIEHLMGHCNEIVITHENTIHETHKHLLLKVEQ